METIKSILTILSISLIITFIGGCQESSKLSVVVPLASSSELNVRAGHHERAFQNYGFKKTSFSPTITKPHAPVQQLYVPVAKKDLPSIANQRRIALVIGNATYLHAGKLGNPINDARAMASTLRSLGFKVIEHEDVSLSEMKKAVDEFGTLLDDYDVSLFFYAGHGIQVNGKNYLIPVDAKIKSKNDVEYNAVEAGRILSKMEDRDNKTNIIILDACRNNPFERSWNRAVRINGGGTGLAFMNAPSGSLIAYSTAPGNTAADGEEGTNGLYTASLLKHMKTPNITIEEMFKRVRADVEQKSHGKQVSWESTSLKGSFFFKVEK